MEANIGYLGEEFQFRLVHHFMSNKDCFVRLVDILDQNMFTNMYLRKFVGLMKSHYAKYDTIPSYDIMSIAMAEIAHDDIDKEIFEATVEKIKATEEDSVDYINDLAIKFFRQQNIIKTANEILKIAGNGDTSKYEKCVELLNDALRQGSNFENGDSVFDDLATTLSEDFRIPIPTGVKCLDDVLEGGIAKGELGMIICSTGQGKTSLTTGFASHAATYQCPQNGNQGYKVLQIVFEDRVKQIQRKHIARIVTKNSGRVVEAKDLSKPENVAFVREQLETYPKKDMLLRNLKIVKLQNGDVTPSYIRRLIKQKINEGFKPDMVIIDYFECMDFNTSITKNMAEHDKEMRGMRKFEAMATEFDVAMWIPSQGNRDSIAAELVTMDKVGGAFKKCYVAHIVMSITRSSEDMEANRARFSVLKNRAGKSGVVVDNVMFNNGTCIAESAEGDSAFDFGSLSVMKQKETNEMARKIFMSCKNKS